MINNLLFSGDQLVAFLTSALGQTWYLVVLNAFGVIAMLLKVTELQLKKRNAIIVFASVVSGCWVIYFSLQGDFASALSCLIGIFQSLIFLQRGKHKWADSILWLIGILIVRIAFGVLSFKEWHDIFSISAGIIGTFAYFVMKESHYRAIFLVSILLWVVNSAFKFYIVAFLNDSFASVSAIVAILRYDLLKGKFKNVNSDEKGKDQQDQQTQQEIQE